MTEKPAAPPAVADPTPETARALLYRHGLPEDVIDGALCLHAQELAAVQRREADDLHQTEPGVVKGLRIGADLIDPTTPDDPAVLPAVPVPPTTHAGDDEQTDRLAQWLWDNCAEDERTGLLADDPRRIAAMALRWPELRSMAAEAQQQPDTETRDALMRAHVALAEQAGQDQAILARVRRLYESGPLGTCCAHLVGAALSGPGRVADEGADRG